MTHSKKPPRTPKFRHHKASGQGFVELNGHRHYLGRFDLPETAEAYHRLVAEWIANGRSLPVVQDVITIMEVLARYLDHAKARYRTSDNEPSREHDNFRRALRPVRRLYGNTKAVEFGPRALRTIRQLFIEAGNRRSGINSQVRRIKAVFKWAVGEQLVPPHIYGALCAVEGLKQGHPGVLEPQRVLPVSVITSML